MVAVHELVDSAAEAAELAEELEAALRVSRDDDELVVVEGSRLLEDAFRHGELADVVEQPADRKCT